MIYFLGDVHGHFDHVRKSALAGRRPDALVFLGDIEPARSFMEEIAPLLEAGIEVRWIRGNHDTDTHENWDKLAGAMHLNIDGQVVEIAGLRIAGLGGVFRGEIWYPDPANAGGSVPHYENYEDYRQKSTGLSEQIRANKARKHLSSIFWNTYEQLWEQRADILVTHEAPGCHPNGFTVIDELAQAMGVSRVFHGHHHDSLDYRSWDEQLRFKAFGVGFCGISDENGTVIRAGDYDEARSYRMQRLCDT